MAQGFMWSPVDFSPLTVHEVNLRDEYVADLSHLNIECGHQFFIRILSSQLDQS